MRLILVRLMLVFAVAATVLVALSGTAEACEWDDVHARCKAGSEQPGSGGGDDSGPSEPGSSGKRQCQFQGKKIPCSTESGSWSVTYLCYLKKQDPQPPKDDPRWDGHEDGAIYDCFNPYIPGMPGVETSIWLQEEPAEIDLVQLARRAIASLELRAIEIGLSVPDRPDRMIYVGAPVWMWTADPDPQTIGPNRASASNGGVTVAVNARLESVTWEMGDGGKAICSGTDRARGTVYKPGYGLAASPTCGYRYEHAADRTTIRAISHWVVDWNGAGETGTIEFDLTRTTDRPVGEIQIVRDHVTSR